jgi:hypothetical protein
MSVVESIRLLPSADSLDLLAGFGSVLSAYVPESRTDEFFTDSHDSLWSELVGGGWFAVGATGDAGAELDLRDLLEFSETWGRAIAPLPFVTTMLAVRWGLTDAEPAAPLTVALAATGGRGVILHSERSGTLVLGKDEKFAPVGPDGTVDAFAPSLPLRDVDWQSPLTERQAAELRACLAAEGVGAAQKVMELGVAYAKIREAYGQPIGSFQAVKHRLANIKRDVELARSAAVWAAQDVPARQNRDASAMSLELSQRAASSTLQVFGGIGFTWDLELHFYLRHIVSLRRVVGALTHAHG